MIMIIRALLYAVLAALMLGFILLFFGPILMGAVVSEQLALSAIEHHTRLLADLSSGLVVAVVCIAIGFVLVGGVWVLPRIKRWIDHSLGADPRPPVIEHQGWQDLRLTRQSDPPGNRHTPVIRDDQR